MNASRTVLVTGTSIIPEAACQLIRDRNFSIREVREDVIDGRRLHDILIGVSGYLIGGYEEPTADHFEAARNLETVAWVGTDFKAYVPGWRTAFDLGIALINTPGANARSVAEFTFRLILTMMRPLHGASGAIPVGTELAGKNLALIGLGRIGALVARTAVLGFSMNVSYWSPRRNLPLEAALPIEYAELHELLSLADVVSLHRPGPGEDESPLLGRRQLELLRPGAVLINTAHPGLVDPDALLSIMRRGHLRAAFDGLGRGANWDAMGNLEPGVWLGGQQLGFSTREASERAGMRAAKAVCDVLDGKQSDLVNNPDFLSARG